MEKWEIDFYLSRAWKKMRAYVIKRDKGICAHCGKLIMSRPHVHHTVYLTKDNYSDHSISLNPDLLVTLHARCHDEVHERFIKKTMVNDDLEIDYSKRG